MRRRTIGHTALVGMAAMTVLAVAVPGYGAAASAGSPAAVDKAAPPDFHAQATDWLDSAHGYLLGTAPCGAKTCTDVLATTDHGTTWTLRGHTHARITTDGGRPGVGEIRFGDAVHGWAFAPLLRHTDDGGVTWTVEAIPGDQGQVLDLATDAQGAWAVTSPCRYQHFGGCRNHPLTLWRTTTETGTTWRQVDADLPYNFAADVSAYGTSVYVTDPQLQFGGDDVLLASTDGKTFAPQPTPCDHTQDIELIQTVATSSTNASMLCDGDPGLGKAVKTVFDTEDNGSTYKNRGMMGLLGIQAQLAASPSGDLAVASVSSGSFIYVNHGGTTWTMPVGQGDGGLGWNDIVYVTKRTAYVVYSPTSLFQGMGRLWVTHDKGDHWADVSPI